MSEGSHITCPRCQGTGHIRDTESSALQILRMVQEESMKDNTAAVHVQVPVEVVSFLLNEKRQEISRIELKQRVNVLLIPNPHLQTPNYRLERLRHDDPRLESFRASYTMIEEPSDEVEVTRREKAKAKQEPVIKGVIRDEPAPMPVAAAPAPAPAALKAAPATESTRAAMPDAASAPAPASAGFFAWIKRIFGGAAPAEPTAKAAAASTQAAAAGSTVGTTTGTRERKDGGRDGRRGGRGERSERGEGRRGGREGRESREGRAETRSETTDAQKARPESREARDGREPREGRSDRRGDGRQEGRADQRREGQVEPAREAEESPARSGERRERRDRRGERRGEGRTEATDENALIAGTASPGAGSEGAVSAEAPSVGGADMGRPENAEGGDAGETGDGRRRRRRGGRGRNRDGAEQGSQATADAAELVIDNTAAVDQHPAMESSLSDAGGEPDLARQGTAHVAHTTDEGTKPEAQMARGQQGALAEASADASAVVSAEPGPASVKAAEPFVLPIPALEALAAEAGLQWVHSDVQKVRAAQDAIAAAPQPVHVPRQPKPRMVHDEGPLVLVETRKDLSQVRMPFDQ